MLILTGLALIEEWCYDLSVKICLELSLDSVCSEGSNGSSDFRRFDSPLMFTELIKFLENLSK